MKKFEEIVQGFVTTSSNNNVEVANDLDIFFAYCKLDYLHVIPTTNKKNGEDLLIIVDAEELDLEDGKILKSIEDLNEDLDELYIGKDAIDLIQDVLDGVDGVSDPEMIRVINIVSQLVSGFNIAVDYNNFIEDLERKIAVINSRYQEIEFSLIYKDSEDDYERLKVVFDDPISLEKYTNTSNFYDFNGQTNENFKDLVESHMMFREQDSIINRDDIQYSLALRVNNEIVGVGLFSDGNLGLFLDLNHRRKGYGKYLLKEMINLYMDQELSSAPYEFSFSYQVDNVGSEKLVWAELDNIFKEYTEDEIRESVSLHNSGGIITVDFKVK